MLGFNESFGVHKKAIRSYMKGLNPDRVVAFHDKAREKSTPKKNTAEMMVQSYQNMRLGLARDENGRMRTEGWVNAVNI